MMITAAHCFGIAFEFGIYVSESLLLLGLLFVGVWGRWGAARGGSSGPLGGELSESQIIFTPKVDDGDDDNGFTCKSTKRRSSALMKEVGTCTCE